uniref:Uncharacterized protein n=1 Tax=Anguilla anguilla TaxID=7936 RepID=A0A0E9PCA4_ANGAN
MWLFFLKVQIRQKYQFSAGTG